MNLKRTENYLTLLMIRKNAGQRDSLIIGGVFWISFTAMIILSLFGRLNGKPLIIVGALVVVFGFSYLMVWARLEIIRNMIDLIENVWEPDKI